MKKLKHYSPRDFVLFLYGMVANSILRAVCPSLLAFLANISPDTFALTLTVMIGVLLYLFMPTGKI